MNNIDNLFEKNPQPEAFSKGYISHLISILKELDHGAVEETINLFMKSREEGKKIIFLGNGGSAATASHFANDIGYGTRTWNKPFKALAITDNNAVLTALGNDEGYDEIFQKQLQVLMEPGDLVVSISASGNSPNVIKAIEYANSKGNHTVSLAGFDGGKMKEISKTCIWVNTMKGEYGPVEDVHMILDHLIGSFLQRVVKTS